MDHLISDVVIDEKRHLVIVGHDNRNWFFIGEPISVYTFSGKLVASITDGSSYPPIAIDTKCDLIARAVTDDNCNVYYRRRTSENYHLS